MVQIVGKVMSGGKLESLSLNDGKKVSQNVEPLNEEMAAELNRFNMYDMLKIYSSLVKGDKIILTDIEHKEVLDLHGPLWLPQVLNQGLSHQCTCFSYMRGGAPARLAGFDFPRVSNLHLPISV